MAESNVKKVKSLNRLFIFLWYLQSNCRMNEKTITVKVEMIFIKKFKIIVHRKKGYGILLNVVKNKSILTKKVYAGGKHGRRN